MRNQKLDERKLNLTKQTVPNIHDVLVAINLLEELPEVKAYLRLRRSLEER